MKLLLFADQLVGQEILDYLLSSYVSDLVMVVTTSENEIYARSKAAEIPATVYQGDEQLLAAWRAHRVTPDLGVLAWWPHILRSPLLKATAQGFLNFHPSLLPHNRGKHPNFWALVEQAPYGVTIHHADARVDGGDIVAQRVIPYDWTDTGETLYTRAQRVIVDLFRDVYPRIRNSNLERRAQDLTEGSFHIAAEIEDASRIELDRDYRARSLLNLLRARTFAGKPACYFDDIDGSRYEVRVGVTKIV